MPSLVYLSRLAGQLSRELLFGRDVLKGTSQVERYIIKKGDKGRRKQTVKEDVKAYSEHCINALS